MPGCCRSKGGVTVLVDPTTLGDLEIFESADGSGGVFAVLDRTRTPGGRAALRRRIQAPPSAAGEIRRTQDAVRFLVHHAPAFRPDTRVVEAVLAYTRSNVAVSKAPATLARAEQAWMVLRFGEVLRELRAGIEATNELFDAVASLCRRIEEMEPPAVMAEMVAELERAAGRVHAAMATPGGLLCVDRELRTACRGDMARALEVLAELDALQSMAEVTKERRWAFPELVDADSFDLEAEDLCHPFIVDGVPNPVRLTGGEPMVFLTGPNMAGKTTYLRSVALAVLLAHTGMGVPARRMRLTPVEALFTSLNPSDNLKAGLSYFLAEVMRVKAAATLLAEGRRALIMFDEVFKGTNVRDALDASTEVILGFAKARGSGFIFSSHLAELVETLSASTAIRFCCFDGDIVDGVPHYGYRLRDGVSDKRLGLLLLSQAEVPQLLARIA
jgi:DNA mismatch repair protein MutS